MELWFKGYNQMSNKKEIFYYKIDRKNKKLWIANSLTHNKITDKPFMHLFDDGNKRNSRIAKLQERITDKMNDRQFEMCIQANMMKVGYQRINKTS